MIHCLLHIQDLTAERQDCLEVTVASLLGRTACRVPFDKEQFAKCGIFRGAVGQLAGKPAACHRRFALYQFASLTGCLACLGCQDHLVDDCLGFLWMFF